MKSHREWTLGALCWFFLLFNIERLVEAVNLASFVYFVAFLAAATMLWSRRARGVSFGWTSSAFLVLMLFGKAALGYSLNWQSLPLTGLEAACVAFSQWVALKVAQNTDEFLMTSRQLLGVLRARSVADLRHAEPILLDEVRRARRHERPLSLVGLSPLQETPQALRELVRQMELSLGKEYVIGCISEILDRTTKSHDLTVRVGDHLLMLLPETNAAQAQHAVQRLKRSISETIGVEVKSEVLEFGVDELTMTGVLDRLQEDLASDFVREANDVYRLKRSKSPDEKSSPIHAAV